VYWFHFDDPGVSQCITRQRSPWNWLATWISQLSWKPFWSIARSTVSVVPSRAHCHSASHLYQRISRHYLAFIPLLTKTLELDGDDMTKLLLAHRYFASKRPGSNDLFDRHTLLGSLRFPVRTIASSFSTLYLQSLCVSCKSGDNLATPFDTWWLFDKSAPYPSYSFHYLHTELLCLQNTSWTWTTFVTYIKSYIGLGDIDTTRLNEITSTE
jgi:hypothetical protein